MVLFKHLIRYIHAYPVIRVPCTHDKVSKLPVKGLSIAQRSTRQVCHLVWYQSILCQLFAQDWPNLLWGRFNNVEVDSMNTLQDTVLLHIFFFIKSFVDITTIFFSSVNGIKIALRWSKNPSWCGFKSVIKGIWELNFYFFIFLFEKKYFFFNFIW